VSEESGRVRHIVVAINKSRTLRFDKPFASAVVGAPDIMDALPMSDRVLYIQGKKVGTTNVSVFDQSMKLIGVLDVSSIVKNKTAAKARPVDLGRGIVPTRIDSDLSRCPLRVSLTVPCPSARRGSRSGSRFES
jgi:pilus assembly protein CpaC